VGPGRLACSRGKAGPGRGRAGRGWPGMAVAEPGWPAHGEQGARVAGAWGAGSEAQKSGESVEE
jgi:hypothetical protein